MIDLDIPKILHGWRGQLRACGDGPPRRGSRGAAERGLVGALLRAALAPEGDEGAARGLAVAAVTYGSTERIRRLDPSEICAELGCLRNEVWKLVRDGTPTRDLAAAETFILHLDQALSIATTAVLRGSYAREIERREAPGVEEAR